MTHSSRRDALNKILFCQFFLYFFTRLIFQRYIFGGLFIERVKYITVHWYETSVRIPNLLKCNYRLIIKNNIGVQHTDSGTHRNLWGGGGGDGSGAPSLHHKQARQTRVSNTSNCQELIILASLFWWLFSAMTYKVFMIKLRLMALVNDNRSHFCEVHSMHFAGLVPYVLREKRKGKINERYHREFLILMQVCSQGRLPMVVIGVPRGGGGGVWGVQTPPFEWKTGIRGVQTPPLDPKTPDIYIFFACLLACLSERLVMYEDTPTPFLENWPSNCEEGKEKVSEFHPPPPPPPPLQRLF